MKNIDKILENYKIMINNALKELKNPKTCYRQIPNILTTLRLTAPLFIVPATLSGNIPLIISLVAIFGLTDFADGQIARRFNLSSDLGKDLDAIADKIFSGTLLLAASLTNPLLFINLVLEAVIATINSIKTIQGHKQKSTEIGRFKTWFLFTLAGAGLVAPILELGSLIPILFATTAILQTLTIESYLDNKNTKKPTPKQKENQKQTSNIKSKEQNIDNQKEKQLNKKITKEETIESLKNLREELLEYEPVSEKGTIKPKEQNIDNKKVIQLNKTPTKEETIESLKKLREELLEYEIDSEKETIKPKEYKKQKEQ